MKLSKLKLVVAALLAANVMMFVGCKHNNNDGDLPDGYYYTSDYTTTIYVEGDDVTLLDDSLRYKVKISITNSSNGYINFSWSCDGDNGVVIGYYDSEKQTLTMQSGISGVFYPGTVFLYNGKAVPIH